MTPIGSAATNHTEPPTRHSASTRRSRVRGEDDRRRQEKPYRHHHQTPRAQGACGRPHAQESRRQGRQQRDHQHRGRSWCRRRPTRKKPRVQAPVRGWHRRSSRRSTWETGRFTGGEVGGGRVLRQDAGGGAAALGTHALLYAQASPAALAKHKFRDVVQVSMVEVKTA